MNSSDLTPGDRVYHAVLGACGTWLGVYEGGVVGEYSRVELEDTDGRILLAPTDALVLAGAEVQR